MKNNIVITVPKLSSPGGVSSYWNSILPEISKFRDLQIQTLEIGGHGKNLLGPFMDQWKFRRIANQKVDAFVLNPSLGSRSFFRDGLFAKRLSKKNIRFFVFFHGWDLEFEKKVSKQYRHFFNKSFGKATTIFVLSAAFKEKLVEWGFEGEVIVETTTVDKNLLDDFYVKSKLESMSPTAEIRILFLSRLLKEKGIFETITAFKKLRALYPKLELIIAGSGKDFDEVANFVGKEEKITMKGHVIGEDKANLFKECQIYCLPSYTEGLPTSVLEAMAFGLAVITTPVGGLIDFFQDDKMGYFVQPKDATQLLEKLRLLVSETEIRERMAIYNYEYAQNKLLSTTVARRLYEHLKIKKIL